MHRCSHRLPVTPCHASTCPVRPAPGRGAARTSCSSSALFNPDVQLGARPTFASSMSRSCLSLQAPASQHRRGRQRAARQVTRMGNTSQGGLFAPIVVVVRKALGTKRFNSIRGQAIAKHSQIIQSFCKFIGANRPQVQGLIRTAKKNGGRLGFLA